MVLSVGNLLAFLALTHIPIDALICVLEKIEFSQAVTLTSPNPSS